MSPASGIFSDLVDFASGKSSTGEPVLPKGLPGIVLNGYKSSRKGFFSCHVIVSRRVGCIFDIDGYNCTRVLDLSLLDIV